MPTKTIPNPSLACSPGWPVVCSVSRREPLGPQWVESPGLEGKALILQNLLLPPLQLFQRWEWGSWRAACPPWLVAWPPSAPPSPVKFPLAEARRRTSLIESRGSKVLSSEASASCLLRLQRELIVEFTLVLWAYLDHIRVPDRTNKMTFTSRVPFICSTQEPLFLCSIGKWH